MKLNGVDIPIKKYSCSLNGGVQTIQDPYVNLYIKITDNCQASCKFCEFRNLENIEFDLKKLVKSIKLLKTKFLINKVSFTGGEPLLKFDELKEAIVHVRKLLPKVEITLNTNGINLNKITDLGKIHYVAMSRHHYDDKANYDIFGSKKVPSFKDIKNFPDTSKLHLRCNLIKGFIDSKETITEYLNRFSKIGVIDFGFVSLMPLNSYCKNKFISYEKTGVNSIPNSRMVRKWTYHECHCKNYIAYTHTGNLVKYYARVNQNHGQCESIVVFDKDKLRVGFSGEIIDV